MTYSLRTIIITLAILLPLYTSAQHWITLKHPMPHRQAIYDTLRKQYDSVKHDIDDFDIVMKHDHWGLAYKDAREILPCTYANMDYTREYDQFAAQPVNGKWGIIDTAGRTLVPFTFDSVILWQRYGPNIVMINGRHYLADTAGKLLTRRGYDRIEIAGRTLLFVWNGDKEGLIDTTGAEVLPPEYEKVIAYPNKPLIQDAHTRFIAAYKKDKWGIIDLTHHKYGPFIYDEVKYLTRDLATVKRKNKWAMVNSTGQLLTDFSYDDIGYQWYNDDILAFSGKKYYYMEPYQVHKQHDASADHNGHIYCHQSNIHSYVGHLRTTSFTYIIDGVTHTRNYDDVGNFIQRRAIVSDSGYVGFITPEGRPICNIAFTQVDSFFNNGTAWVQKDKKWGLIDTNGNYIIPCTYTSIGHTSDNRVSVTNGDRHYIIDLHGNIIKTPAYINQPFFSEGLAAIQLPDSTYTYIDTNGNIIGAIYTHADHFYEGRAWIAIKDKWALIDKQAHMLTPLIYDNNYGIPFNNTITATQGRRNYVLDLNGHILRITIPRMPLISYGID